ncbi:MAG: histidine phosphatase family protein [Mesorhizobium sp.]|nr:histidine phosphatase family protein [Mesorhizobium sp.]
MTDRTLLLLRHAKSSWDDPALADFDRPLAPRGETAAPVMGAEMARRGWRPDHALVSPSRRTRETWALVAPCLAEAPAEGFPERLYMAGADDLMAVVREAPAHLETLLVVGHNPGLEDFAARLAGDASAAGALDRMRTKFPTGALARFEFEGAWRDLAHGSARLTHFLRPKDLAGS